MTDAGPDPAVSERALPDRALEAALSRLDRAVARIERVRMPVATPPVAPGLAAAYAELDERHGLLRLRIQETIERLDALIEQEAAN